MSGSDETILGPRRLRALLAAHSAAPKRSLGQNFVIDPNTIRKVIAVAEVSPEDRVVEIGAGCGSLTLGLAAVAAHVHAVEIDDRLVEVLGEVVADKENVTIVHGDALRLDLAAMDAAKLIGNLPYNIATPLVLRALAEAPEIEVLTVMTQREVGERLAASPGSKIYGQTSVMVRYYGQARVAARISRRAFYPVPRVDSVLVRIERSGDLPAVDRDRLFAVIRAAFAQRRKTVRNTIVPVAGSIGRAMEALDTAGVSPQSRAEDLDLAQFVAITDALS